MSIKSILLTEAVDLSTADSLIKAIQKGNTGVKPSEFLNGYENTEKNKATIEKVLLKIKDVLPANQYNAGILLFLKKISAKFKKLKDALVSIETVGLGDWADSLLAYFSHKDKRESKEDPTVKEKINEYINGPFSRIKDKEFEQFINKFYADRVSAKEANDITIVYGPDDDGWEIIIPNTYSAASKYACMNSRKSEWCTAANPNHFKNYTKDNNKLYIIRSKAKDLMFQMDWGVNGYPNFKNEKDNGALKAEIKAIPNEVLKKIINPKTNKSVFDYVNEKNAPKKEDTKKGKIDKEWKLVEIDLKPRNAKNQKKYIFDILTGSHRQLRPKPKYFTASKHVEDLLLAKKEQDVRAYNISNSNITFIFINSNDYFYGMNNNSSYNYPLFKIENGITKIVRRAVLLNDKTIPTKIKNIVFGNNEETNTNIAEKPDFDLVEKYVDGSKLYRLKNGAALLKFFTKPTESSYINAKNRISKIIDASKGDEESYEYLLNNMKSWPRDNLIYSTYTRLNKNIHIYLFVATREKIIIDEGKKIIFNINNADNIKFDKDDKNNYRDMNLISDYIDKFPQLKKRFPFIEDSIKENSVSSLLLSNRGFIEGKDVNGKKLIYVNNGRDLTEPNKQKIKAIYNRKIDTNNYLAKSVIHYNQYTNRYEYSSYPVIKKEGDEYILYFRSTDMKIRTKDFGFINAVKKLTNSSIYNENKYVNNRLKEIEKRKELKKVQDKVKGKIANE